MEFNSCAQCGAEIEAQGIHYRGRNFCSDECCEEFAAALESKVEPAEADLAEDDADDDALDDDLGYRDGDDFAEDDDTGDEFEIKADDF